MKAFRKRFDLTDLSVIDGLLKRVEDTHRAIQTVEAGVKYSRRDMALATFRFLDILGYYPETVKVGMNTYNTQSLKLMENGEKFRVDFRLENRIAPFSTGIFGALEEDRTLVKLDDAAIKTVVDTAFPKAQLNGGTDVTMDHEKPHLTHMTIREQYMQSSKSTAPVASGSATCSDLIIALMQATTRMVHAILVNAKVELLEKHNKDFAVKSLGDALQRGTKKYNYFLSPRDPGVWAYGRPNWNKYYVGTLEQYLKQLRHAMKYSFPDKPVFGGHSLTSVWFDELVKPADDASDENWLKWSTKSPDPVKPKPAVDSKSSAKKVFDAAIAKTREDFYRAEGKTIANVLAWQRTEAYLRKVFNVSF